VLRIKKEGEKHGKSNRFGGLVPLNYDDTLAKETRPFFFCTDCRWRDLRKYNLCFKFRVGLVSFSWIYSTCSVYMTNWNFHLICANVWIVNELDLIYWCLPFVYFTLLNYFFYIIRTLYCFVNYSYCWKYLWNVSQPTLTSLWYLIIRLVLHWIYLEFGHLN